jgi:MFS family permease
VIRSSIYLHDCVTNSAADVLWEIPSNLILSKTKPSIFLPVIMSLWGIATCCMAKVQTSGQLIACRVIVGILEAGFAPGILLIISSWYRPNEQSTRFAIYISAAVLSGAFGGILAGAITEGMEGVQGLRGWRWLFVSRFRSFVWSLLR